MREPWLVFLTAGVAAAMATGCEERVRECGGGVEVVVSLDDLDVMTVAGDIMWVSLDVDGVEYRRDFPSNALGGGATSFTLDLDNSAEAVLGVAVEIAYDGPGFFTSEVVWLHGEGSAVVPVGDRGCLALPIELTTAPDRDGDRVPDTVDSCDDKPDPAQEDTDLDRVGDACDGCRDVPNPDQADRDTDATQDACDVCPDLAFEGTHDEDGDLVPDACDPCPHLTGDRADGDGDRVGDACDPRPTDAGDSIVAFLDFEDPGQLTQLTKIGTGVVSIEGGQLVLFTTLSVAAVLPRTLSTSGVVVTRVHQSMQSTFYPWGAGTIAWVDLLQQADAEPDGVVCLSHNALAFASIWPTILAPVQPTIHDPDVVARWSFVDEGSVDPIVALGLCTTDASTATYDKQWSGGTIHPGFGLMAHDAVARFDYLLLIDSP